MTFQRRSFLLAGGAGLVLAGCVGGEDGPVVLSVNAQAQSGMNPGPDGSDRPVTINILQMSGSSNFDAADAFALQDPSAAVGGELIKSDQLVLAPGGSASTVIPIQAGANVIGVTGGFRDPAGKSVRQKIGVPGASQGLVISVGPGGLSLNTV